MGPVEDVESNVGAGVADVAEIIGRDATDVHAHLALHPRLEELLLLAHRVEDLQLRRPHS